MRRSWPSTTHAPTSSRSWPRSSCGVATSRGCSPWRSAWRTSPRGSHRRSVRVACTCWGEPARRPATRAERSRPFAPPSERRPPRRRHPRRRWRREMTSPIWRSGARTGARPPLPTRACSPIPTGWRARPRLSPRRGSASPGCAPARRPRRSSHWRRRWRSTRAAPACWSRWWRRRGPPATTRRSCATRRRCWRSPTIRRPSWRCSSTWRRSTASGGTIRSERSRPIWRRSRSGRTSGRSCTGCSSSTPTPSNGSSRFSCWRGWRRWRTTRRARPTSWPPATSWRRSSPRGERRSRPSNGRWTPIRTTSRPSSASTSW